MYRQGILLIALFSGMFGYCQTFAQTTIDLEHNSMRLGDMVKKYRLIADNIWNLSLSERCSEDMFESYESFKTDTITLFFDGTRNYYLYQKDTLLSLGSENPRKTEDYYLPEVSTIFPTTLGSMHEGCFAGYVEYCDKMRFHKYGTYTVCADTIASLVLPDNTVIDNVLQVSRKRTFLYEQLDSDTSTDKLRYNSEEIRQLLSSDKPKYIEHVKKLYANGYRYPLVRGYVLYDPNGNPHSKETSYFPIYEQECLPLDEENMLIRRNSEYADSGETIMNEEGILVFISNSADTQEIIFDCERFVSAFPPTGTVRCKMLLSDSHGILHRAKEFSIDSSCKRDIAISYSGLRRGHYAMSLIINTQAYPFNFYIE